MNLKYIIAIITTLCLSSCASEEVREDIVNNSSNSKGTIALTFDVDKPVIKSYNVSVPNQQRIKSTQSTEEVKLTHLELWVFDEDGDFLYKAVASPDPQRSNEGYYPQKYSFQVKLQPSTHKRIIHFVGNYTLPSQTEGEWYGRNEKIVVPMVRLDDPKKYPMWCRMEYEAGLSKTTQLGDIQMLLAVSKFTLNYSDNVYWTPDETNYPVVYAINNIRKQGTICTFDGNSFNTNAITEVLGDNAIKSRLQKSDFVKNGESVYLFEQSNKAGGNAIPYIVLHIKFHERGYDYYRLDFVERMSDILNQMTPPKRFNLVRGHWLSFYTPGASMEFSAGVSSLDEIYTAGSANDYLFSPVYDDSNYIASQNEALQVSRTTFVIPHNHSYKALEFPVRFYDNNIPREKPFVVSIVDKDNNPVISNAEYIQDPQDKTKGDVKVTLKDNIEPYSMGKLIVGAGTLRRTIKFIISRDYTEADFPFIVTRNPSNVTRDPSNETIKAGTKFEISFTIPKHLNPDALPIRIYFLTYDLMADPSDTSEQLISGMSYNGLYYSYTLKTAEANKKITLHFIANKDLPYGVTVKIMDNMGFVVPRTLELR